MVLHPYPPSHHRGAHHHHGGFSPRYPMKPRTQAALLSQQAAAAKAPGANPESDFDGKRPRKSLMRKTVDYNASFLRMLENRIWSRPDRRNDRLALQPDIIYYPELLPPQEYAGNPANAVTTKFVKTATNKMRCPLFTLAWTPEGRRLITGASSGEFTLWNGLTFNFETILQAHDSPVRAMEWSHSDEWMVTGDHGGYVKYWQSNMNNVKMFQAHKEAVRSVSFSPTDAKFATSSDDGTVRIWDFHSCTEERVLRGHGADVKSVDWHPTKGLLASGSKDSQQPIKIWEPRTGAVLATLHAHKNTVMSVQWNKNGNWLLTASRDHLLKLFDIRNTKEEVQVFRGHKKEASTLAWHPVHESLFASGGSDGAIMFWNVGAEKEVGVIEAAHDSIIWSLAWHPVGHILCSGSNDHTCKYWTRNRPGDTMRDKYNLNMSTTVDPEDSTCMDNMASLPSAAPVVIPGMGEMPTSSSPPPPSSLRNASPPPAGEIPGLEDSHSEEVYTEAKKKPYAKPIPRNFMASWANSEGPGDSGTTLPAEELIAPPILSLQELQRQTSAVVACGNIYPVFNGSNFHSSILNGENAVKEVLQKEYL
eukprot:TRINITY_DN8012_c0_g1_i1.p1 TRINITY_DN8012_c0_g1~~TRINITY_DN8012_c0_g1_i1.p1  ORF type:complete len:606 (+),score=189.04 TRINITY_DN8012_c0_g1_i1:48-1820(+)